jgi:hypothetical protein
MMSATAMGQRRRGNGDGGDGSIAIAMGQEQQGQLQGKRNGATVQRRWGKRAGATAMAMAINRISIDFNGDGATAAFDRLQQGNGNGQQEQLQ